MDFSGILNRLALAEVTLAGAQPGMADAAAALVAKQLRVVDRDGVAVVKVVDDHGNVRIADAQNDLDVAGLCRELVKKRPVLFRPAPEASTSTATPDAPPSPSETVTDQMVRLNAERAARSARADELGVKAWPNPWAKGSENLTHQMVIENFDPARASRLKAEAGAR